MRDGKAYSREELKKLECPMKPSCNSRRTGFRQRKANLCEICHKKMVHCQSGTSRSRRTEKRLAQRAAAAKINPPPIVPGPSCSQNVTPTPAYNIIADRIIKPESRTEWRRPCLENVNLLLIGDSQISRLETLIENECVQLSLPGADILDLTVLLEFGKMKFSNFANDARRNEIAKNWDQYRADLSETYVFAFIQILSINIAN